MSRKETFRLVLAGALLTAGAALLVGCGGGQARSGVGTAQQIDSLPGLPGQTGPAGLTGPTITPPAHAQRRADARPASGVVATDKREKP